MSKQSRLVWRCRRGTRELDTLLQSFLANEFDQLSEPQQRLFDRFLDEQDPDIYNWITGYEVPSNPDFLFLIERLQQLHAS